MLPCRGPGEGGGLRSCQQQKQHSAALALSLCTAHVHPHASAFQLFVRCEFKDEFPHHVHWTQQQPPLAHELNEPGNGGFLLR